VVLVIRGGIGFLPLLCARNGCAKKVIVLEESACIEYARQIVKDNNYCHKITLIQSSVMKNYNTIFIINNYIKHFINKLCMCNFILCNVHS
jgi:hypothetical protein